MILTRSTASIDRQTAEYRADMAEQIDAECDRRIAYGILFGGKHFQCRGKDMKRITGAASLAGFAIVAGAQAGDLYWHGEPNPFRWIALDNTKVSMDAQTCFAFGQAAAAHEAAHIFAARALKDATTIPDDFTSDTYWPPLPA